MTLEGAELFWSFVMVFVAFGGGIVVWFTLGRIAYVLSTEFFYYHNYLENPFYDKVACQSLGLLAFLAVMGFGLYIITINRIIKFIRKIIRNYKEVQKMARKKQEEALKNKQLEWDR